MPPVSGKVKAGDKLDVVQNLPRERFGGGQQRRLQGKGHTKPPPANSPNPPFPATDLDKRRKVIADEIVGKGDRHKGGHKHVHHSLRV